MAKQPTKLPYVQRLRLKSGALSFRGWVRDGDGRKIFSACFATEQEAYDAHLRMLGVAQTVSDGVTLQDACKALLEDLRHKRTDGSVRWYDGHLRAVQRLIPGTTPLHRITPATIEQFIRDRLRDWAKEPVLAEDGTVVTPGRQLKPATVNADLRALHRVFAVAIRKGQVDANPVRQVDRPRADATAMDWFTEEELRALLGRVTDQGALDLFTLLSLTGIRRSEAARLRAEHVRLRLSQLVVPGKNATRIVPIAHDLEAPLRRLLASAGAAGELLPGGLPTIDKAFVVWKKTLGERRLHPHTLRHTFGTSLIRGGTRPDVVMRLMGHRSLNTTLRYVHEVGADGAAAVHRLELLPRLESDRASAR